MVVVAEEGTISVPYLPARRWYLEGRRDGVHARWEGSRMRRGAGACGAVRVQTVLVRELPVLVFALITIQAAPDRKHNLSRLFYFLLECITLAANSNLGGRRRGCASGGCKISRTLQKLELVFEQGNI